MTLPLYAAHVDRPPEAAVLVPVKSFDAAKARLASVLGPVDRAALARWCAGRVVAAAAPLEVAVVCDDDEVAAWAIGQGATVVWAAGLGLDAAVGHGLEQLRSGGDRAVIVAHGDLPLARGLVDLVVADTLTLVPDHADDGTNVVVIPAGVSFRFSYGRRSFARHLQTALGVGCAVAVRRDPLLALDLDTPTDLVHPLVRPLVQEVLTTWLPTTRVNLPAHAR